MILECQIKKIVYTNPQNGYTICQAKGGKPAKIFTLVIKSGMIDPQTGVTLNVVGDFSVNPKFGEQFVAESYEEIVPTTKDGIVEYLSCGIFKGIGGKLAQRIVDSFGENTFDIIENHISKLSEVKGITPQKAVSIQETYIDNNAIKEKVSFLRQYGVSMFLILKIYKRYGKKSIEIVSENPYILSKEIDGIGFVKADDIALKLGFERNDPRRIQACIKYVLLNESENGHTYLKKNELLKTTEEYLGISIDCIDSSIKYLVSENELKTENGGDFIFDTSTYNAERNVVEKLMALKSFVPYVSMTMPTIEEIEASVGIKYNEKQKDAIRLASKSNIMVLTGGPGTGKTTTLLGIINMLRSMDMTIAAAAPTGRAAKRMSEVTGMNAMTIHRLLEYKPDNGYGRNENKPLYQDVIIIDEVSMVNVFLMNNLMKAIKSSSKVIFVGDENQLPCIGPGNILHDIIESGIIPVVTLNEIFRQSEGSRIVLNAHNIINETPVIINNGLKDTDFFFIDVEDYDLTEKTINDLVTKRLPLKYGVKPTDIQVLSPRRKDCKCSANELNKILQTSLNKTTDGVVYGDTIFKIGDKVMQIKNNYEKEVFNGDVGFVDRIDVEDKVVYVNYDGLIVDYTYTDLDELILAYASTIHKSQGSEYPIVIIPLLPCFSIMLKRNLIYTGITRAKNICVIIGSRKSLYQAIRDNSYVKRNTMMAEWLSDFVS